MKLNRSQLLVHDDATPDKFRKDHGILDNVLIERPRPLEDGLRSFPRYNGYVLAKVDRAADYLHQLKKKSEGLSSNKEEVKEVGEVTYFKLPILITVVAPALVLVTPVLVVSSGLEASDDLDFSLVQHMFKDLIEHLFIKGGGAAISSKEVHMAPKPKDIGPKKGKGVTPQIVQILTLVPNPGKAPEVGPPKRRKQGGKLGSVGTSSPSKAPELWSTEFAAFELGRKKRSQTMEGELKNTKDALVAEVKRREDNDNKAAKALCEVTIARERMIEAVQELTELKKIFNEEEYANQPAKDEADPSDKVRDFMAANKLGEEVETSRAGERD
ncbi:hypothetical protein Acr_00g0064570 [Actinidia rufa]|uniref:Uncharacterized protein n=1 Tax=Actinidia rufa TaxID=165716 RepID=A0A7J0DPR9_9ERIC|nr:hypothetical protein Acr_00g0064570 [Actinidia rufa]